MDNVKFNKSSKHFVCEKCDYTTVRKSQYDRHILTSKHKRITMDNKMDNLDNELVQNQFQCQCGKAYNYLSGLCKHKKKCKSTVETETDTNQIIEKPSDNKDILLDYLIKQNSELQKQILEVCKNSSMVNNTTNHVNSHNKTFNLQVFLNEDCKDAMNINEFIDSIQFQLSDLENVGRLGYVEGISNIIIKNLNALDVTKRPVHCTDPKRETIYIKDGGNWEKDENGNKKLRKMVKSVAFRNSKNTRLFKEKYPDCIKSESRYSDIYNKIVIESMGGGPKCNDFDSENKIIRKIAQMITIDKQRT